MSYKEVMISVKNLKKKFKRKNSTLSRLSHLFNCFLNNKSDLFSDSDFYALEDITFDVHKGETVGIVGENGSGKSTLLQIICGTLMNNGGEINVKGRIAALLELGSGFNPEFTGRENVFMNAYILGMTKHEIENKFDDIVEFSEIGGFIDQPVKNYSSGMLVRLAFSVAISVEPEILVVDEALAVGDELFQRKCYSKINNLKKNGATVLFVSHDAKAVIELCDRAILLHKGKKIADGNPKKVIAYYQKLLYSPKEYIEEIKQEIIDDNYNSEDDDCSLNITKNDVYDPSLESITCLSYPKVGCEIVSYGILNNKEEPCNILQSGYKYKVAFSVEFDKCLDNVRFSIAFKTSTGLSLGGYFSHASNTPIKLIKAGETLNVEFDFDCILNSGTYFINIGAYSDDGNMEHVVHRIVDAIAFKVTHSPFSNSVGTINFNCSSRVSDDE